MSPQSRTLRVGISSCLLGEKVRYDGGHRYHPFINRVLGRYLEWVPVCPEVEIGLGTPREPIELVAAGQVSPQLVTRETREDLTARMLGFALERTKELEEQDLHGYVFKSGSPSCGPGEVDVHDAGGQVIGEGEGVFARVLREQMPLLPVESERALEKVAARLHFVERILGHARVSALSKSPREENREESALPAFHARHVEILRLRDPGRCDTLSRIAREAETLDAETLAGRGSLEEYARVFMEALAERPARELLERTLPALDVDRSLLDLLVV